MTRALLCVISLIYTSWPLKSPFEMSTKRVWIDEKYQQRTIAVRRRRWVRGNMHIRCDDSTSEMRRTYYTQEVFLETTYASGRVLEHFAYKIYNKTGNPCKCD